jgi:hypothetical protein
MEQGAIPNADARLATRAVLGLHNSVWHWYRWAGTQPGKGRRLRRRPLPGGARRPESALEPRWLAAPRPKN